MESLYPMIGQNILIIDKYMKLYLKNALKRYDLNTAEGMVLLTLYGSDGKTDAERSGQQHGSAADKLGITQDKIIDELHYDKGVMTRTMQALERKGYVMRQENSSDGRSYIFKLTKKAAEFKPSLLAVLRLWSHGVLGGIDQELIEIVDSVLKQMAENAKTIS